MLIGEYRNKLDAKGRISVPVKFRDDLTSRFILTRGLDNCLFGYTLDEWQKLEEKIKSLPFTKKDARAFQRFFFAGAIEVEVDKQGRINIPKHLCQHANLEKNCVIIGTSNRIEVWDEVVWDNTYENAANNFEQIAEDLDFDF